MMTALHQQVRRTLRRHELLPGGSRVLIGLSGGSDSVALTCLLLDLSRHGSFEVAGCAHLNHELRETAGRDEQFCRDFAARAGLSIQIERGGVKSCAVAHALSIEEAARRIRYAFLNRAAIEAGADRIAVGHTRDDQAETFLMKLVRGAGPSGLGGIYPRRGAVIRPLLEVSRVDLRAWLRARSQPWVEDETNLDLENPRNRIRLKVLPELTRVLGGDPAPPIARAAALLREDGEWLDEVAGREFDRLVERQDGGLALPAAALEGLAGPVLGRVLRLALAEVAGAREVGHEHVEAVRAVLARDAGAVDVPGGRVELSRDLLVLLERGMASK